MTHVAGNDCIVSGADHGGSDDIALHATAAPPLRDLIDESMMYARLVELTGLDFGPLDQFKAGLVIILDFLKKILFFFCKKYFFTKTIQYTLPEFHPIVHQFYFVSLFEAVCLAERGAPDGDYGN